MQENTESEKSNETKTPEKEEELSDEKPTSKPSESSEYEPPLKSRKEKFYPLKRKKAVDTGYFFSYFCF